MRNLILMAFTMPWQDRPLKQVPLRQGREIFSVVSVLVIAGLYISLTFDSARGAERVVDLELVLAADISGSMDTQEATLQRSGFVQAIQHPLVIRAIRLGHLGRIAVSYVEWASVHHQSTAIDCAARSFKGNGFQGRRRIVDISGDGPNNQGDYVIDARNRAVSAGIVINGLPIINDRLGPYGFPPLPNLDFYYTDCVIGGHGSFIVVANEFRDFARAIRRKMVLEIAGAAPHVPLVRLVSNKIRPPCDVGEQQLRGWMFDFN